VAPIARSSTPGVGHVFVSLALAVSDAPFCQTRWRSMSRQVRIAVALAASSLCLSTAVAAFWYQDWQYSLPTPKPTDVPTVAFGTHVDAPAVLGRPLGDSPLVIHVVDPDCPCSRFNRDHLRALVRRFGGRLSFVALVQGRGDGDALVRSFRAWDIPIDVVADEGGRRAAMLGVYSTPQAVVLTADGRLYFRGNYNSTRYCVDARTEFARIAIEHVLSGATLPALPEAATVAYGCPLRRAASAPTL
jgi:hypothetical protein